MSTIENLVALFDATGKTASTLTHSPVRECWCVILRHSMSLHAQSTVLSVASFSIGTITWRTIWARFTGSELHEDIWLLKGVLYGFLDDGIIWESRWKELYNLPWVMMKSLPRKQAFLLDEMAKFQVSIQSHNVPSPVFFCFFFFFCYSYRLCVKHS